MDNVWFERHLNVLEKEDGEERQEEGEEGAKEESGGGKSWSCRNFGGKMWKRTRGGAWGVGSVPWTISWGPHPQRRFPGLKKGKLLLTISPTFDDSNWHSFLLQNRMLAESLFKVFDDDNSGTFSFEEYYQVLWLVTMNQSSDSYSIDRSPIFVCMSVCHKIADFLALTERLLEQTKF